MTGYGMPVFFSSMKIPCFACESEVDVEMINTEQIAGRIIMVHMGCCGGRGLFRIDPNSRCSTLWTDLEAKEVPKFVRAPEVSVDDVLEVHTALKKGNRLIKQMQ